MAITTSSSIEVKPFSSLLLNIFYLRLSLLSSDLFRRYETGLFIILNYLFYINSPLSHPSPPSSARGGFNQF